MVNEKVEAASELAEAVAEGRLITSEATRETLGALGKRVRSNCRRLG